MRKQDTKKNSGLWFAVTALIISLLTIGVACMRYLPVTATTTESFIGVLVSLLALCVTFVLGYQIINILDLKESAKEIKRFEQELEQTKKELSEFKHQMKSDHYNESGFNLHKMGDYNAAVCMFINSLLNALKCYNTEDIELSFNNIDTALKDWENDKRYNPYKNSTIIDGMRPDEITQELIAEIISLCSDKQSHKRYKKQITAIKEKLEELLKRDAETPHVKE